MKYLGENLVLLKDFFTLVYLVGFQQLKE